MLNRLAIRRKLRLLSYAAGEKFLLLSLFLFLVMGYLCFPCNPNHKNTPVKF